MHLRDYLHDIPLKALKTIADTLGIEVEYRARIKLMNAIDRAFWDTDTTRRLVEGLSVDRRLILSILAFSYRAGVGEQQLVKKAEKITGLPRKDVIDNLHELMPLALAGGIDENGRLYFCPGGVAEQVRTALLNDASVVHGSGREPVTLSPPNLLEDIFSFLAHVYKRGVPLTLMGRVRKTVLERIFSGSPTCSRPDLHFPKDQRNAFVTEYLRARSLVAFDRKEIRATATLRSWLDIPMTERLNDIVAFAYDHRIQDTQTIVTLQGFLSELPAGASLETGRLAEFLHTQTAAAGGLKRIASRVRDFMAILSQLGMLSFDGGTFTVTVTGEQLFHGKRLSLDDAMRTQFTVQPNFDVIVGPELDPGVRFTLELLSERRSRDTVLTFKVTQEGVTRARERGMSTSDIIRFFHDHSRTPIPQNVRFSVESWADSYGSIFFENATLLRCRDDDNLSRIVHAPELAPYIIEQLSDTALVVSSRHVRAITDILKRDGFSPETFTDRAGEDDENEDDSGFEPSPADSSLRVQALPAVHADFIIPARLLDEDGSP